MKRFNEKIESEMIRGNFTRIEHKYHHQDGAHATTIAYQDEVQCLRAISAQSIWTQRRANICFRPNVISGQSAPQAIVAAVNYAHECGILIHSLSPHDVQCGIDGLFRLQIPECAGETRRSSLAEYHAPCLMLNEEREPDKASDMWEVGRCIFTLLSGRTCDTLIDIMMLIGLGEERVLLQMTHPSWRDEVTRFVQKAENKFPRASKQQVQRRLYKYMHNEKELAGLLSYVLVWNVQERMLSYEMHIILEQMSLSDVMHANKANIRAKGSRKVARRSDEIGMRVTRRRPPTIPEDEEMVEPMRNLSRHSAVVSFVTSIGRRYHLQ